MNRSGSEKLCFGTHHGGDGCDSCGDRVACVNENTGSNLGDLLDLADQFSTLYEAAVRDLKPEEKDLLDEMIESGGYTASTEDDYYWVGRIPSEAVIAGEQRTEKKMREFLEEVRQSDPKVWGAYQLILKGLDHNKEVVLWN